MRQSLLVLGCAVVSAWPAHRSMPSFSPTPGGFAAPGSNNLLCNRGRIICVSKSVTNSLITNPFRIDVDVSSADDIEVAWEIRDSTGQVLESASTYELLDVPTRHSLPRTTLHIQDFIFVPAKSQQGTLTLSPSRYAVQTGKVDLPGFEIPVRLTTARSSVTTLEPEDPDDLKSAAIDWIQGEDRPVFNPQLKLIPHRVEVMRFDRGAIVGITAEAVLRSWQGQEQWHVTRWDMDGSTAHVTMQGGGWAGSTYYSTEVTYLIKKSVLNLPGIKTFVFDRAR